MKQTFYNLSAALGLDGLFASLNRKSPIVLGFHGVTSEPPGSLYNYEGSHLHRPLFETLMRHVASRYRFVALDTISDWLAGGEPPPERAVAVTFDDGYRNVLTQAAGVLRDVGAPATVFVTTGFILEGRMLWPDRLLAALALTSLHELTLERDGSTIRLPLGTDAEKIDASNRLRALCKSLPDEERIDLVDDIVSRLEVDDDAVRAACADFRPLEPSDLGAFEASGIRVGSHTVTHPILARCPEDRMHAELRESRREIERLTGRPCTSFGYPNGAVGDFNVRTREAVIAAGYKNAVTTVKKRVTRDTDPYEIPRYLLTHRGVTENEFVVEVSGLPTFVRGIRDGLMRR